MEWLDNSVCDFEDTSDENEESFFECNTDFMHDDLDMDIQLEEEQQPYKHVHDQDRENEDEIDNKELYPGSKITVGAFMLLLAVFTSKFNITGDGIEMLLKLIGMILPEGHNLCNTLYAFKKYFTHLKNPLKKHYYCPYCCCYIEDKTLEKCPNNHCSKDQPAQKHYFLEVPMVYQIQNFFKQDGFDEKLQYRFQYLTTSGKFRDIYDGSVYQNLVINDGPLSSSDNISFTFNADGAPVFKSSKLSIWPLYLMINELPYKNRVMKENMIMAGLWFDSKKPAMNTFLKPFLHSMEQLDKGIQCLSPPRGTFTCKGYLLAATADLPARSLLCNAMQYNGAYSCWKCL